LPPTSYRLQLAGNAELVVWFLTERASVISYSVVLLALHEGAWHTVRVYDNAHGANEMHRYTVAGGKQPAEPVHAGEAGEAMRSARDEVLAGYEKMIEAWRA
jgi:hypothetical protein